MKKGVVALLYLTVLVQLSVDRVAHHFYLHPTKSPSTYALVLISAVSQNPALEGLAHEFMLRNLHNILVSTLVPASTIYILLHLNLLIWQMLLTKVRNIHNSSNFDTVGLEEPGINPTTFQLVDNPFNPMKHNANCFLSLL